jgi:hypothetical protein
MRRRHVGLVLGWIAVGAMFGSARRSAADELELRGGGRLSGIIVQRTQATVTLETGTGLVTLPLSLVLRVNDGRSALETWRERSSQLSPTDLAGWTALARWAAEHDLLTQARSAWERVLGLDPGHPEANTALGNVRVSGAWTRREEASPGPAPAPRDDHSSAMESAARVREAEARAREAEARARAAEAGGQSDGGQADDSNGIPIWWGASNNLVPDHDRRPRRPCCGPPPPTPGPEPPGTPTSSIGPTRPPTVSHPGSVRPGGRSSVR